MKTLPISQKVLPTIHDVARLAGVSHTTAARVFADSSNVKKANRDKVLRAGSQLGYVPNPLARGLRGGDTQSIGIIWSLHYDPFAASMLHEIASNFQSRNYLTNISDISKNGDFWGVVKEFVGRRFDGIIIQTPNNIHFTESQIVLLKQFKAVLLVCQEPIDVDFDQMILDRLGSFRSVAEHFAVCGREKIAFIDIGKGISNKFSAFNDELISLGLHSPQLLSIDINYDGNNWELCKAVEQMLENNFSQKFPFDAVMCIDDAIAFVLLNWLTKKGYSVPEDIAVCGFDNTPVAAYTIPPLASVERLVPESLEMIETMVFNRIADPGIAIQKRKLSMEFVWRPSAGRKIDS